MNASHRQACTLYTGTARTLRAAAYFRTATLNDIERETLHRAALVLDRLARIEGDLATSGTVKSSAGAGA